MTEEKVRAIVLSSRDYKEKDKLVELFTVEDGLKTVVLKGVKNNNAKFKFAKEPFCFGEFVLTGASDIKTVTQANLVDSFYDISNDYDRFIAGCKILKLIPAILGRYESNSELFLITLKALKELAYSITNENLILCTFITKAFAQIGYKINVTKCAGCGDVFIGKIYLNADTCEVVCGNCRNYFSVEISGASHNAIKILSKAEFDNINTITIDTKVLTELLKIYQIIMQSRFNYKENLLA